MARKFAPSKKHEQTTASDTWTINHGMNSKPSVSVFVNYKGTVQEMLPKSVQYPDDNTVVIGFSQPYSGEARLV